MPVSKQAEELFVRLLKRELATAQGERYEARIVCEAHKAQLCRLELCQERCKYLQDMLEELENQ